MGSLDNLKDEPVSLEGRIDAALSNPDDDGQISCHRSLIEELWQECKRRRDDQSETTKELRRLQNQTARVRTAYDHYKDALSRIDYAIGGPNDMDCSVFDFDDDHDRVRDAAVGRIQAVVPLMERARNAELFISGLPGFSSGVCPEKIERDAKKFLDDLEDRYGTRYD